MDENFKDSLNIYAAACLTFGYDKKILNEETYEYYSSILSDVGFSKFSSLVFGKEYSLLISGIKNAVIGLRAIEFNSIVSNVVKKNYLKKLFSNISKEDICSYAYSFLKNHGFKNINTKSINFECTRILKLIGVNAREIPKKSLDDGEIKTSKNKKENNIEGKFSPKLLKKVDVKKILSCDNICVQNMDSMDREFEPLESEKLEELRRLFHIYTGDKYVLLNGLLRGRVRPLYDGSNLEKMIKIYNKKINETQKYLKIYEPEDGYHDLYILPLDIYKKIKNTCHSLTKALREKNKTGTFWRFMDTRGLKAMIGNTSKNDINSDVEIKKHLNEEDFINKMNENLEGLTIMDSAFLSTSFSNGVEFIDKLNKKAIVLKIDGKELPGILVGNFTQFEDEQEFLVPPRTKLRITSVSHYNGVANKSKLENECIQINCVNV